MSKNKNSIDVISIPKSKDLDVDKIVTNIKKQANEKHVNYLKQLDSTKVSTINTWENGEFLADGWHEPEDIGGTMARWTKGNFSFYFRGGNKGTNKLILNVVAIPPHNQRVSLTLKHDKKKISRCELDMPGKAVFHLPDKLANNLQLFSISVNPKVTPSKDKLSLDHRELGVAIDTISSQLLSSKGFIHSSDLDNSLNSMTALGNQLQKLSVPDLLLPKRTRLRFFKSLILKLIRVYTSIQSAFNTFVFEYTEHNNHALTEIVEYIKYLDSQLSSQLDTTSKKDVADSFKSVEAEFYTFHQSKFRNNKLVKQNQQSYIKHLKPLIENKTQSPFIELGFGDGSFIKLLNDNEITNVIGVDINPVYINNAKEKGFKVVQSDAVEYMSKLSNPIAGFSSFHLFEHLRFDQIYVILSRAFINLENNGVVIIETPNPENIQTAAHYFYLDYTHVNPLPPLLLQSLMEFIGYKNIQITRKNPMKKYISETEKILYGEQDYAIIATK